MHRALVSIVSIFLGAFLALPALSQATVAPAAQTELSKQGVSLKVDILSPTKGAAPNVSDLLRDASYAKTLDNFQQVKRGVWTTNGIGTTSVKSAASSGLPTIGGDPASVISLLFSNAVSSSATGFWKGPFTGGGHAITGYTISTWNSGPSHNTPTAWDFVFSDGTIGTGGNDSLPTWLNQNLDNGLKPLCIQFTPSYTVLCPSWQPSAADIGRFAALSPPATVALQEPFTWNGLDPSLGAANEFVNSGSGLPATPISGGRSFAFPTIVCNYSGRCVYAGFTKPSGTNENQNYVLISNFLDYNHFSASVPPVATDGGYIAMPLGYGAVTSLYPFLTSAGNQILIVGCEHGIGYISGTDETNFAAVGLTNQYGAINTQSWQQIEQDVYFLATDGIRKFSSNDFSFLTTGTQSPIIQNLVLGLNPAFIQASFCAYHPATRELFVWVPFGAEQVCGHALVFNFNGSDPNDPGGQVQTTPIVSTRSAPGYGCAATYNGFTYLGDMPSPSSSSGGVALAYSGNTYEGTGIPFTYTSALIPANSPAQEMSNRKFVIMTEGADQNFTASAYTLTKMGNNSLTQILQASKTFATGAPPAVADLSTWGITGTGTCPKLFDFDSRGSGRYWCLGITGTTGTSTNGIDLVGVESIMTVGGWRQ